MDPHNRDWPPVPSPVRLLGFRVEVWLDLMSGAVGPVLDKLQERLLAHEVQSNRLQAETTGNLPAG